MSAAAPTRSRHLAPASRAGEAGFSLVEVLVVMLVLGVLAGIVFITLRRTRGSAEDAACETDRQTIERAVAAYRERTAALLSEEALVIAGYLRGPSLRFDVRGDGAVVAAPGSGCSDDGAAQGAPPESGPGSGADTSAPAGAGVATVVSPTSATASSEPTPTTPAPDVGGVRGAVVAPTAPGVTAVTSALPPAGTSASGPGGSTPSSPGGGTLPFATVPTPPMPADGGTAVPSVPPSTTGPGKVDDGPPPMPTGPPATIVTARGRRLLVVTLTWTGNADLDLWVQNPQGVRVGWSSPTAAEGAFLDIDVIPPRPDDLGPHVERTSWPVTGPGPYTAWVRFASGGWGRQAPGTGYTLAARGDDELLASVQGPIGEQGEASAPVRVVLGT